ncbi:MAG: DUF6036 family nucleotidyltransferase [Eggerthellaceae bacterium]|nr:DUF6036 family nucleotidyltransferase [Eggerthellaceae bacterium]
MTDLQKDSIFQCLTQLDDDLISLYGLSKRFEMVVIGGSALMLMDLVPNERFTTDIDILRVSQELESLLERYDMNTNAATYLYKYPLNWARRLQSVPFDGQVLDVYVLSNEDLAITKLLAWRAIDKKDLEAMRVSGCLDFGKLGAIFEDVAELRPNLDEEEWAALMCRYEALKDGSLA